MPPGDQPARWQRYWDKKSRGYDREMGSWDRLLFGDSRQWACSQASGDTLEVAIGTGLNIPFYADGVRLTGIDLSEAMLEIARSRAKQAERDIELHQGNAHALPFETASFDAVVCTFGLCAIPDPSRAIDEMVRVLRPDGTLILLDHVRSSSLVARGVQWLLERVTVPLAGEHFLRRPLDELKTRGLQIERVQRFKLGLVERLVAHKAEPSP